MKAVWNDAVIAESDDTVVIEGNHYFPPQSVNEEFLVDSATHTTCHWKGVASYKTLSVHGQTNPDAVWFYPEPKEATSSIAGYYAFWKGVRVTD